MAKKRKTTATPSTAQMLAAKAQQAYTKVRRSASRNKDTLRTAGVAAGVGAATASVVGVVTDLF